MEAGSHGAGGGGSPFWFGRGCSQNLDTGETGSVTSRTLPRLQNKASVSFHPCDFPEDRTGYMGRGTFLERARPTDPILASVALHPAGTHSRW